MLTSLKNFKLLLAALFISMLYAFAPLWGGDPALLEPRLKQALSNTAIVQTQKITIAQYPKAFNPSLVPYKEGYLLSFRIRAKMPSKHLAKMLRKDLSFIGVAKMDKHFRVYPDSVQSLEVPSYSSEPSSTAEDARLLYVNERLFVIFNDLPPSVDPSKKEGEYHLYLGELIEKKEKLSFKERPLSLKYTGSGPIEKNWTPFVSEGQLYLIYADEPRIILHVDIETGLCKEVTRKRGIKDWDWGEIRGGTPALALEETFLTFFHSRIFADSAKKKKPPKTALNYVMGAYQFEKKFPFAIRAITPTPLGDLENYAEKNAHKVLFPSGIVLEGNHIHVVWGKNDKKIYLTTFDKNVLLNSMKAISSEEKAAP